MIQKKSQMQMLKMLSNLHSQKYDTDRKITFIPEEFTADGFQESAIHAEWWGSDLKCVAFFIQDLANLHNLRKTVERWGYK